MINVTKQNKHTTPFDSSFENLFYCLNDSGTQSQLYLFPLLAHATSLQSAQVMSSVEIKEKEQNLNLKNSEYISGVRYPSQKCTEEVSKGKESHTSTAKKSHQGQAAGTGRQLEGLLKDIISFTFLSLRGSKTPGLSSLICGSTKPLSPTSLTEHFWKTWREEFVRKGVKD